jgi:protein-L-isoaspartate(D-aspartate) O-methyltransferase
VESFDPAHGYLDEPNSMELARLRLVRYLSERCGIRSPSVLDAMARVPREAFVSEVQRELAYADRALPIAYDQTISQPYIVALMTELADLRPGERVLEIGTGCGYQTAVLAATGAEVFSVEIVAPLARSAAARLRALGVHAQLSVGDGHLGLPAHAPYMAILVTAAPPAIPSQLVQQLAIGGRLIIPVGAEGNDQELLVVRRLRDGQTVERVAPVRFVPMTGQFH